MSRSIDAVFVPKDVYAAAARVAVALDLPGGWLNDAVKSISVGLRTDSPTKTLEVPGLRCEVASAEMVAVLQCLAHRLGRTTTLSCSRRSSGWTLLPTCSTSSRGLVTCEP